MSTFGLRSRAPGPATALVEDLDGRRVVTVRIDGSEKLGALSSSASFTIAEAADTARAERLPLVLE
ncbi:MAG: hypothetical protein ACKOD2_16205, partial [Ilumatobacteraceae bacterium]